MFFSEKSEFWKSQGDKSDIPYLISEIRELSYERKFGYQLSDFRFQS